MLMVVLKKTSEISMRNGLLVASSLLFAGSCYQWPLFSSNQNVYFVNGLARAGYGYLASDWFAHHTDAVPIFSALVYIIRSIGSDWIFYALQGLLAFFYALSLFIIACHVLPDLRKFQATAIYFGFFMLIHLTWVLRNFCQSIPAFIHPAIIGFNRFADLMTNGLAEQYLLGRYLQPSTFGVLLLASLAFFLSRKDYMAILCSVIAATIHTSLILHAGILTTAYILVLISEEQKIKAIKIGLIALVLILPILIYLSTMFFFADTSAIRWEGQEISAVIRQPHHALVSVWFRRGSYFQLALIAIGLVISKRHCRLFSILLSSSFIFISLSVGQVISGNLALALLFPWRTSVWLVPLCSVLLLGRLSDFVSSLINDIRVEKARNSIKACVLSLSIGFLFMACGLGLQQTISGARRDRDQGTVISYAKLNASSSQRYLIPLNFERFRLSTGLPVFIDWKCNPHRSRELIEWNHRIQLARAFYEARNPEDAADALIRIQDLERVTHVVMNCEKDQLCRELDGQLEFEDGKYFICSLCGNGPD